MKRRILLFTFLFTVLFTWGQQPEPVYSITKVQKDYTYYNQQADLWENEVNKKPKSADAWFNYYTAARMNNVFARNGDQRFDMEMIANNLKKALPGSYEYFYVTFKQMGGTDESYKYLKKAYAIDPDRFDSWEGLITKALFDQDTKAMKTYFEKWSRHFLYSPGIVNWNYNTLIGLEKNAVLFTFGDNDTYPLWFLQLNKNIRTDVKVINASLLMQPTYRKLIFEEMKISDYDKKLEDFEDYRAYLEAFLKYVIDSIDAPTYLGISVPKDFRSKHDKDLYLVGLAFKYSKEDFDHVAMLRNNYENHFLTDYLKANLTNDFSQSVVDYMNQQYIPCLTVLYKHYKLSGELQKSKEVKMLLERIGEKSNREDEIKAFIEKTEN